MSLIFDKSKLKLAKIDYKLAKQMIIKNHYSHKMPTTILNIGIYYDNILNGVICFCQGACNNYYRLVDSKYKKRNLELIRMWSSDNMPKNLLSRAISIIIKRIKKQNPLLEFIISFADETKAKHNGIIYKASNFIYCGYSNTIEDNYIINGKVYHLRGVNNIFGNIRLLKQNYPDYKVIKIKSKKHRYIYPLKDYIRKNIIKKYADVV